MNMESYLSRNLERLSQIIKSGKDINIPQGFVSLLIFDPVLHADTRREAQ